MVRLKGLQLLSCTNDGGAGSSSSTADEWPQLTKDADVKTAASKDSEVALEDAEADKPISMDVYGVTVKRSHEDTDEPATNLVVGGQPPSKTALPSTSTEPVHREYWGGNAAFCARRNAGPAMAQRPDISASLLRTYSSMCDTAFEIVLLGLLKLSKNVSLLKAALHPDLEGGQRSGANRLHIVYYTAASALALWLLFAIIQVLCFSVSSVTYLVFVYSGDQTAAYGEIKAQQGGYNSATDWVTATSVLALLIGALLVYCCLLVIYYLRVKNVALLRVVLAPDLAGG
ncbi:hypothetical protein HPB50_014694 [Hyalomma asiaticum]|uniref:Uncharacterized protein n=1 Tax=Hyalomma asiaticum TaxID=266040 RepID=A0ACB7T7T5_HYAAI|nr:hypothetical protein HPB50_014694 [Hyalomma asiaticum]